MAVTSIWRIKGYIGKVILYAENPDKTITTETILTEHDGKNPSDVLKDVLTYTERESATEGKRLVSGVNCNPSNAAKEMMRVKQQFGKTGGVTAYHGYQSFSQNEVDADTAHLIGVELANRLWGDKYQVVVTTHIDKESHIHNHFILNTVSFIDGIKYYRSEKDYYEMRKESDKLCREYGLSVLENPKYKSGKSYFEYAADKNGDFTKNGIIRRDIDECIQTATTMRQFFDDMKKRGYTFDLTHKYATVYHANFPKARRLKTLGEAYTLEAIQQRVSGNWVRREYVYPEQDKPEELFFNGDIKTALVFYNYQTVYVHFVRGLAVVKERGEYNRELQRLLGDELIKFDKRVEEQNLLLDNDLYTQEDITAFRKQCSTKMDTLTKTRTQLRNQLKCAVRSNDLPLQNRTKSDISLVSQQMKKLRRNITVIDRILNTEPKIESDLRAVKDYTESLNRKERTPNEHIRRRSRTSRESFKRSDGSTGVQYNVKKVFDISQTNAKRREATKKEPDYKKLVKALVKTSPVPMKISEEIPEGMNASYNPENKVIFVRQGLEGADVFRALSVEIAFAKTDQGSFSRKDNAFQAYCVSYMVCRRSGIEPPAGKPMQPFNGKEAKEIRSELGKIRDEANSISSVIQKQLEPKSKDAR